MNLLKTGRDLRNALIYIYWQLDLDQVYGVLQNDLETLKSFLQEVKRLLDQEFGCGIDF